MARPVRKASKVFSGAWARPPRWAKVITDMSRFSPFLQPSRRTAEVPTMNRARSTRPRGKSARSGRVPGAGRPGHLVRPGRRTGGSIRAHPARSAPPVRARSVMPQLGPLEIAVVLLVALLVFGPDRLPQMAKQVGGALRELRRIQQSVTSDLRDLVN
ncbi:MAG: twin-arginine translocase TatA/TatE family subunit, partial [Actinomycetes bacterium]